MAKKFEGSAQDVREDKAQAKKAGMSMKDWENSPADKKHDARGGKKHHGASRRTTAHRPASPMPGPHEFDADQEQAMRQGNRPDAGPPMQPLPPAGGADDYGGV